MSGWESMVAAEPREFSPPWAYEDYKKRNPRHFAYAGPTHLSVWTDAVDWVKAQLMQWPHLTEKQAILELRRGPASIFYPFFADEPLIFADCPTCGRVVVGVEGYCDQCKYDFTK